MAILNWKLLPRSTQLIKHQCLSTVSNLWNSPKLGLRSNNLIKSEGFCSAANSWRSAHLTHRSLIRVEGYEAAVFLQGLVTNDVNLLVDKDSSSLYCMFLNTGGRILFDSIICPGYQPNEFIIEVDSSLVKAVVKHLKMYKVRRKLLIESIPDSSVYAVYNEDLTSVNRSSDQLTTRSPEIGSTYCDGGNHTSFLPPVTQPDVLCHPDPRLDLLGYRYLNINSKAPETGLEVSVDVYTEHRYILGVPEGKLEIIPTKALPLEHNMDYLHGVSFHKGCYIGQELTARTHHTGVIRKRILPVNFTQDVPSRDLEADTPVLNEAGKSVGKMRSLCGQHGLAMLRLKETFSSSQLTCGGLPLTTYRPEWWPKDKTQNLNDDSN